MEEDEVTEKIIGCAMRVHSALGPGFLESVYQNALAHELSKAGLRVECGSRIKVCYDNVVVGEFICDMLVEEKVLLELKANQCLVAAHDVQLVHYLTATGIEIGLLLNFGGARLEFRRNSEERRALTGRKSPPRTSSCDAYRDQGLFLDRMNRIYRMKRDRHRF